MTLVVLCHACELDRAISTFPPPAEAEARLRRAVRELHLARQALDRDGNAVAAQVLSECIWEIEAAQARIQVLTE